MVDHVGLWEIVAGAKEVLGADADDEDRLREEVLNQTRELIEDGWMIPGHARWGEFHQWNLSLEETIEKIEQDWRALGRNPAPSAVVEFFTMQKGEELLRKWGHLKK